MVGHEHHRKLIAKDDRPLTEKEAAKEEERLRRQEEREQKHQQDSDSRKQRARQKDEEQERKFVQVVSEVYDFSFAGEEVVDGEPAWVIRAVPRANYEPHSLEARLLKCMQGELWITKRDYRWARAEGEMISDFKFGLFLLNLHKGMRIHLEQTRINGEVWLPRLVQVSASARLGWHTARVQSETTYSNYKKFRTDSKITGIAPAPQ